MPRTIVSPVAPAPSVACPTAIPNARKSRLTRSPSGSRRASGRLLGLTSPAARHATHVADDADESAAVDARISLGRTLLIAAGAALHRVVFVNFGHWSLTSGEWRVESGERCSARGAGASATRERLRMDPLRA